MKTIVGVQRNACTKDRRCVIFFKTFKSYSSVFVPFTKKKNECYVVLVMF